MDTSLTADRVHTIMLDCLFKTEEIVDGQPPEGAILVDGIVSKFDFHSGRIDANKAAIAALLGQLPASFHDEDGDSFLNACLTKDGTHWGEHRDMQALMVLGAAAGLVWVLPREMWFMCPGNMPAFGVKAAKPQESA